jgi:hypothetical protein
MRSGLALIACACACGVLAGCSGGSIGGLYQAETGQTATSSAGAKLTGTVHGGQQPITGAHVYLFAANAGVFTPNTNGYGNASLSLLTSASNTTLDSSGGATNGDYYVTTDSSGNFAISGDYTCAAGQQVYLYSLGGNPGSGTNAVASLMAVLGNCPTAGNFTAATPYIVVNEVSTIAAAYAVAGFATDPTHLSGSGTTLALTGIANAFANAANLGTLSTGVALATTPSGYGTVPRAEINTLADMLAACINSTGAITGPTNPTTCYTLFNGTLSGGSTGAIPNDTASAAINIAHNPGISDSINGPTLYGLITDSAPFQPTNPYSSAVAYVMPIVYGGVAAPRGIAIDGSGNVWMTGSIFSNVFELSSSGAILSGSSGYTGGGISRCERVYRQRTQCAGQYRNRRVR